MSQQLRATGDTNGLEQVVERAKLLMVVQEQTAAITSEETEVTKLQVQVSQSRSQRSMCSVRMETQDVVFTATSPDTLSAIVQLDVRSEDASTRPPCKGLLAGKRQRGVCKGQQASPIPVSPKRTIIVATIKTQAANIIGKVGNVQIEMLMDSESFISLLSQDIAKRLKEFTQRPLPQITLKTASGEILPLRNHISTQVCIQTQWTMIL